MCGGRIALKEGYFRFIATFTWEPAEDKAAAEKLFNIIKAVPKGIDEDTFEGFYLTGQRTMIFIGQATSGESVQRLSSRVSQGNAVRVNISLAVHVNEFVEMLKKGFSD
jgi:hypothetical protein